MFLQSGRIRIRNAASEDAERLAAWWNDGAVMAHAGWPLGLGTSPERVRGQIAEESDETTRRHIIEFDGAPIGEMNYRDLGGGRCEMGIKICEADMQNRGLGKVILSMFIEGLFRERGYAVVCLDTNLNNLRAQHVYEELGFRRLRVCRNSFRDQLGVWQSSVDYELTPEEFRSFLGTDRS